MQTDISNVLNFWFDELEPSQHWVKDAHLDQDIQHRFGELHQQALRGELSSWRDTAEGRLAEIIVLDQFSRNIYRDEPQSFAADQMAIELCHEAIRISADIELSVEQRQFLYMPLMHSENLDDHHLAVKLFDQPGMEKNLDFELRHMRIIERFGRYPHRNEMLGRDSTPEEKEFLTTPGSSF